MKSFFKKAHEKLEDQEVLYSGDCFALKLTWSGQGELFLLSESGEQLTRLFPNSCHALGYVNSLAREPSDLVFPLKDDGSPSMFKLDTHTGMETIIALAIDANRISAKQQKWLGSIPDKCATQPHETQTPSMAQLSLQAEKSWRKGTDWFSVQIQHE